MRLKLLSWLRSYQVILANASSLVGTTVLTSGLGFIYWWLATRLFPPEAVGLGSATISSMLFLGNVSVLGFGTLLVGELPRQPNKQGSLIGTALLVVGLAGGGFGLFFALIAPLVSADLRVLAEKAGNTSLFALDVSITAIALVLDQAMVGLLRSDLQLTRNAIFAATKLVTLLIAGFWVTNKWGLTIYTTWLWGNIVSLVALVRYFTLRIVSIFPFGLNGNCFPS